MARAAREGSGLFNLAVTFGWDMRSMRSEMGIGCMISLSNLEDRPLIARVVSPGIIGKGGSLSTSFFFPVVLSTCRPVSSRLPEMDLSPSQGRPCNLGG